MIDEVTTEELQRRFPNASQSFLNANTNNHRRALPDTEQRERPSQLGSGDAREAQGTGCVPVCFTLYRVRTLDVDAKYASVKDLLDCLVAAEFLAGDKEGQVTLEVNQVKVSTYAQEHTEITVEMAQEGEK